MVHDLTDNGHVLRRAREFAGLLDVPCTLRDHVLRDRVINVAVPSDFLRLGVAELELAAVDANRRRNVQLIADLVFPSVLNLVDYSLVELDDLSIRVLNLDVRLLERAVAVINLRDLHVVDGNVGADVCRRQSADGGFLCAQHHARTHLERAAIKLRKTVELRALAGTDDGIAKVDVLRRGSEAEADAAGRVLKIIILAVHQRYNALDGKGLARASRKRRTDGNRLRLLDLNSIGKRCGVAVFHVFLRGLDGEGDILSHSRRRTLGEVRAVRRVGDRCALRCAGEGDLRTLFYLARSRGSRRRRDLIGRSRRGIELVDCNIILSRDIRREQGAICVVAQYIASIFALCNNGCCTFGNLDLPGRIICQSLSCFQMILICICSLCLGFSGSIQVAGTGIKCEGVFLGSVLQRQRLYLFSQRQLAAVLRNRNCLAVICFLVCS